MSVSRTEANRYIQLKKMAQAGGGSTEELEQRVGALESEVNGDPTAVPPVPSLDDRLDSLEATVDGSGGLSETVSDLDEQINGDPTTTPATPGIVDEIEALEATVYGDSTASPATKGIVDQLTADNDEPFQFAYDSTTQKYGYKVQIGGADTFVPFSTSSDFVKVPEMTGYYTPEGAVIYSGADADHEPWHAFNENSSTYGNTLDAVGAYIGYHFTSPVYIKAAIIDCVSTSRLFDIKGSNDGINWTTLLDNISAGTSVGTKVVEINYQYTTPFEYY